MLGWRSSCVSRATYLEHLDLAFHLAHLVQLVVLLGSDDLFALDELHGGLLAPGAVDTELDLAKLALTQRLQQQIVAKVHLGPPGVRGKVGERRRRRHRQLPGGTGTRSIQCSIQRAACRIRRRHYGLRGRHARGRDTKGSVQAMRAAAFTRLPFASLRVPRVHFT